MRFILISAEDHILVPVLSEVPIENIQIHNSKKFLFQTKWIKMGEAEPTVQTSIEKIYKINTTDQILQFIQSKTRNFDTAW